MRTAPVLLPISLLVACGDIAPEDGRGGDADARAQDGRVVVEGSLDAVVVDERASSEVGPSDSALPHDGTVDSTFVDGSGDGAEGAAPQDGSDGDAMIACGSLGAPCCAGSACNGALVCAGEACGCATNADCPDGGTCGPDSRCLVTLASELFKPYGIAVDSARVYWTNRANFTPMSGSVMSRPLGGGAVTTLVPADFNPENIVAEGGHIYWIDATSVLQMPSQGGAVTTLAASGGPFGLTVSDTHVYWPNVGPTDVMSIPLAGGSVTTLFAGQEGTSIAVDAKHVYWTSNLGPVLEAPISGGEIATLASETSPISITVDSSTAYWLNSYDAPPAVGGSVVRISLAGGQTTTLIAGQDNPEFLAIDGENIYWTNNSTNLSMMGSVLKVPIAGGAPVTLAAGQENPNEIVVDATSVYWANGGGTVIQLTPK